MQKNRKSNRLRGYDYSSDALYFITPVVQDRICCLGKIIHDKMHLNDLGKIVECQWNWLVEQYLYVILHSFQVMPNHVHGIIEISKDFARSDHLPFSDGDHDTKKNDSRPFSTIKSQENKIIIRIDGCVQNDLFKTYSSVTKYRLRLEFIHFKTIVIYMATIISRSYHPGPKFL